MLHTLTCTRRSTLNDHMRCSLSAAGRNAFRLASAQKCTNRNAPHAALRRRRLRHNRRILERCPSDMRPQQMIMPAGKQSLIHLHFFHGRRHDGKVCECESDCMMCKRSDTKNSKSNDSRLSTPDTIQKTSNRSRSRISARDWPPHRGRQIRGRQFDNGNAKREWKVRFLRRPSCQSLSAGEYRSSRKYRPLSQTTLFAHHIAHLRSCACCALLRAT